MPNYSTYWPIYGLPGIYCLHTKLYEYISKGNINPYATTPPQVIRTMSISRELQLARQKTLFSDVCVPLVHGGMWMSLLVVFKKSTYSVFIARRWNLMCVAGTSSYEGMVSAAGGRSSRVEEGDEIVLVRRRHVLYYERKRPPPRRCEHTRAEWTRSYILAQIINTRTHILRGTIVNRAYGTHKTLPGICLLTSTNIFGPIYYGPPYQ